MSESRPYFNVDDPQFRVTAFQQMLSSCSGALLTSLVVTPLDVAKVRLQAQQKKSVSQRCYLFCNGLMDHLCPCNPITSIKKNRIYKQDHFNGTLDALMKITRNEGMSALWSGLGPTLVLAIPTTVVYFVSYEQLKYKMYDYYRIHNSVGEQTCYHKPLWIPSVAGVIARSLTVSLVSPLELVRTKMQSVKLSYAEIGGVLRSLVLYHGVPGLWRGLPSTLLRDIPFSAIYWGSYEAFKSMGPPIPTFTSVFLSGAVAGSIAAFFTIPFDVVKTHQQIEIGENHIYTDKPKRTSPMTEVIKKILLKNGPRGLFTGLVPRVLRVAPACAIMISSYEQGKKFFYRYYIYRNKRMHQSDISKDVPQKHIVPELKNHSKDIL